MSQTFPVPGRTLPTGVTPIPEQAIASGLKGAILTLDVGSMTVGQVLWLLVEVFDTVQWTGFKADFTGPWHDKQGALHTDSSLNVGFGSVPDANGEWTPRLSAPGWKVRATLTVDNGPITTAGGTLVVF